MSSDAVTIRLQAWIDSLIDLTKRNPLLNLPARSVVALTDPPATLWSLPQNGNRRPRFVGRPVSGETPPRALPASDRAVDPQNLRTLNALRLKSRLSLNEQGINTLFVTFGTLSFLDPKLGATVRAPLLLLPVTLERDPVGGGIWLGRYDDEPQLNPTLRFRLAQNDIRFDLTEPDEIGESDFSPTAFLSELALRFAAHPNDKPGFAVAPDECVLGRFAFLNLTMYQELRDRIGQLRVHPLVAALAGDTNAAAALSERETERYAEVPDVDSEAPQMSFCVRPTDPSQERAILAARYGRNLVIQGPPGTGKTQTITNLIATCIADGKRVLFVSEKMAALDAVHKRLQECGLGDLCLEAHSHKASKHEILEQFRRAVNANAPATKNSPAEFSVAAILRDEFNRAIESLHRVREPLGLSIYDIRGALANLTPTPDLYFALDGVDETDHDRLHKLQQLVERFATFHDLFARIENHPWREIRAKQFSQEIHERARDFVNDLLRTTDALEDAAGSLAQTLGFPELAERGLTMAETDWLAQIARRLQTDDRPPKHWLTTDDARLDTLATDATRTRDRFDQFARRKNALLISCRSEILTASHDELNERLGPRASGALAPTLGERWSESDDETLTRTRDTLTRAAGEIETLLRASATRAALCGLPEPKTLAETIAHEEIAACVPKLARPPETWFDPADAECLPARLETARQAHRDAAETRSRALEIFTDSFERAEIDGLRERFSTRWTSWTKVFSSAFHRDKRDFTALLAPRISPKGRDFVADLARAADALAAKSRLSDAAPGFADDFGARYRKDLTDWDALGESLGALATLYKRVAGAIPETLKNQIRRADGGATDELSTQNELARSRRAETEAALADAASEIRVPGADSRPLAALELADLAHKFRAVALAADDFLDARTQARSHHFEPKTPVATMRKLLAEAAWVSREQAAIDEREREFRDSYAHLFDGLATNWNTTLNALENARALRKLGAEYSTALPETLVSAMAGDDLALVARAKEQGDAVDAARRECDRVDLESLALFSPLSWATLAARREWAEIRLGALSQLERFLNFAALRAECERFGLLSFCDVAIRNNVAPSDCAPTFLRTFYSRWLDSFAARSPEVNELRESVHAPNEAKFVALDTRLIATNAVRIRQNAAQRRGLAQSVGNVGEMASLQRVLKQRKPRASVRKILGDIPNLLFRLKPCLMMSPLSVSLFLDPDRIQFDIVIFDEASQIFPESALGPLMRADQAVIAGDSQQLPPTAFFKSLQETTGDDEDDSGETLAADAREFESVLNAAEAALPPDHVVPLTWHYRSRHESLIDFSRRHFYQNNLATFPAPRQSAAVTFVHVPDGRFRGGTGAPRDNPVEAARVADLVAAFARENPEQSVGVITMSEAQQQCVRAAIEAKTALDPALAALLNEDKPDGFFLKNIENVQGDERDAIFLSVGYGKWESDNRVRLNFGPISRAGGGRRLNVAVTRARESVTVVSSLLPEEIAVTADSSDGNKKLREYLSSARTLSQSAGETDGFPPGDDALAESIAKELIARGHSVRRAVGLSGYKIDLAVCDPTDPDSFVLGIECDSENYLSGETARARTWLRPKILKDLGWRLIRIWSGDWISDRAATLARLEAALAGDPITVDETVRETVETPVPNTPASPEPDEIAPPPPVSLPANGLLAGLAYFAPTNPSLDGGSETLYGAGDNDLERRAAFVEALVREEGPFLEAAVAARLARGAGLMRAGKNIQAQARLAVGRLAARGTIERRGEFLWLAGVKTAPARVPEPGASPRPIEQICREEIGEVLVVVLRHAIGMRVDEAVNETARQLGYQSTGASIRERIEAALAQLEFDRRVHNFHGQLRLFEEA